MFDLVQNVPLQMWFQHILPNTLRWMRLMYENVLWDASYFRHLNNTHTTQKPHCKNFWWKSLKVKAASLIFATKQKWTGLVVSQSNVLFGITHPFFFFASLIGRASKVFRSRRNTFVQSCSEWRFTRRFGHIYWRNPHLKASFFVQCTFLPSNIYACKRISVGT